MKKLLFISCCVSLLVVSCKKDKGNITADKCEGVVCGIGEICIEGVCNCDTGWLGSDCSCALDSFVGSYHITGVFYDTVQITRHNNALVITGSYEYTYEPTVTNCRFSVSFGGSYYSSLTFRKSFDDSIFYYDRVTSPGGGTNEQFGRGKKIH